MRYTRAGLAEFQYEDLGSVLRNCKPRHSCASNKGLVTHESVSKRNNETGATIQCYRARIIDPCKNTVVMNMRNKTCGNVNAKLTGYTKYEQ